MLEMRAVDCFYGEAQVLRSFSLTAGKGEILCMLGRNGAGKTTALKAIMGLVPPRGGSITLDGTELSKLPAHEVPRHGVGYVPQGRRLFSELTVMENLRVGLMTRNCGPEVLEHVLTLFPLLKDRLAQRAGTMSGGEQQMLAMARALMGRPKLLLLDEPSMGLAPLLIQEIFNAIISLREHGKTVFLVEQNAQAALSIADRAYVIETGETVLSGTGAELLVNEQVKSAYLGI